MALFMWPLLVFAYYKQKYKLKNWILYFILFTGLLAVLGSGEYAYIVLVSHVVGIPIIFLSARFIAWCIKRYINRT